MANGKTIEKKKEKEGFFSTFGMKATKEEKAQKKLQDKAKKEFDQAYLVLQSGPFNKLREKDPKGEDLISKGDAIATQSEKTGDYLQANIELKKVTQEIDKRLLEIDKGEKEFNVVAIETAKLEIKMPPELLVPKGATKEKQKQVEEFNSTLAELKRQRRAAEVKAVKTLEYHDATVAMGNVKTGYETLLKQFQPILDKIAEQKEKFDKKAVSYHACEKLVASIELLREQLATAYAVQPKVVTALRLAGSKSKQDFDNLSKEFYVARNTDTGYDAVLEEYEKKFAKMNPDLVETEKTLKAAMKKAPPNGPKELPPLLKGEVEKKTKEIEEGERKQAEDKKIQTALTAWQKAYNVVPQWLTRLLATGKEPNIQGDHDKWKKEYEQKRNLIALAGDAKAKLTEQEVLKDTEALNALAKTLAKKIEEVGAARKQTRIDLTKTFGEVRDAIDGSKKGKAKGVDDDFFKSLKTELMALEPMLKTTSNDAALDHIRTELARIKKSAESLKKDGPAAAKHGDLAGNIEKLETKIDDKTVKECCEETQKMMAKDLATLKKAFKTSGPEDADVLKQYKALNDQATSTLRDAVEIKAKRQVVDADIILTKALLQETIPKIKKAKEKQQSDMSGGSKKAQQLLGGVEFDPKYLQKRLDAIVANHPSERLTDCNEMLKAMREFRLELSKGADTGDFKGVLDDMAKRAETEQMTALKKEKFETALKEFKSGLYAEARGTLENALTRALGVVHLKKREARVKTLETILEQVEKIGKNGDYDSATSQLAQAEKLAQQIIDFPEGSKPPGKGEFKKLGQKWAAAVTALVKGVDNLAIKIEESAKAIAENDTTRATFADNGKKVTEAFRALSAEFNPKEFDRAILILEGEDEAKKKAAKEMALQSMRKFRRMLTGDPLFRKMKDNPFIGVNVKEVYFALDNIDLIVQTA